MLAKQNPSRKRRILVIILFIIGFAVTTSLIIDNLLPHILIVDSNIKGASIQLGYEKIEEVTPAKISVKPGAGFTVKVQKEGFIPYPYKEEVLFYPFQTVKTVYAQFDSATKDSFGNWKESDFDLVPDDYFKGDLVAVLHLYTGEGFDFSLPEEALKQKGFKIHRWEEIPPVDRFEQVLEKSCQLWIISNTMRLLTDKHIKIIKDFFDQGKGLYIWGDNDPYYEDANYVGRELFDITMSGNTHGNQIVEKQIQEGGTGFIEHPITQGIDYLYEGVTIATIEENYNFTPLLYGSNGNIVISIFDRDGKRVIFDGGFTRLFVEWDSAGTGRYVINAASWLGKYEKYREN